MIEWNILQKRVDVNPDVYKLNSMFGYKRNEMKNYLEFRSDKNLTTLNQLEGGILYGHITSQKNGK